MYVKSKIPLINASQLLLLHLKFQKKKKSILLTPFLHSKSLPIKNMLT